jgi:hypothetical protein
VHGLAEAVERLLVVLVGAVGEVEARDVHAGAEQLLEHGHGAGGRAERADELGLGQPRVAGAAVQVRQDLRHVDVRHRAALRISPLSAPRSGARGNGGGRGGGGVGVGVGVERRRAARWDSRFGGEVSLYRKEKGGGSGELRFRGRLWAGRGRRAETGRRWKAHAPGRGQSLDTWCPLNLG